MYRWVTRTVGPLAAMAAVTAATAAAQAGGGAPVGRLGQWSATTPCPADAAPPVSAMPAASPSGADDNRPSLKLAMTARGTRTPAGDVVDYRITARPVGTPLHDVTVTARLTCVPGDAWLAGRPTASAGRATASPRAITWHFDLDRAPATAAFAIRLRSGARGGPLVGEVTTADPVSNCPELRAADTRIDAHCRVTVLVPAATPPAAQGHPAPAVPGTHTPARPGGHAAPLPFPVMPPMPPAPPVPPAKPGPGAAGALPVVPPAPPGATPSPTVLSQLDRPPIVPTAPAGPDAVSQEPIAPEPALRSDTSRADLSGRAFAFLIGGVAFLLIATAIAGSLIGARLRRNADEDETDTGVRLAPRPRTSGDGPRRADLARPGPGGPREIARPADGAAPRPMRTPSTLPDVVRRTAEAGDPPPRPRLGTDPMLSHDGPASRVVVDE